jgi:cyclohexanecarboxylate-CoA ligase
MQRPAYLEENEREYVSRGWWRDDDTLPLWLSRNSRVHGERPAVVSTSGTLTWRHLEERVLRTAAGLKARGVGAGDVVAIQLPNVPELVVLHLALARLGAVMCTVHMPYRGAEIDMIVGHSGAKLFIDSSFPIGALEEHGSLAASHPAPDSRDPFLLLYTSGTTSSPKAVPHPYRSMLGNSRMGAAEKKLSAESRILCAAPFTHLYGLYSLHCAWAVGACVILLPQFKPEDLSVLVEREKPTALWCGPAHMAACRNAGLFEKRDWSSLRLAIVSGSMAPPALMEFLQAKLPKCAVTQLWGMTELQAALYTRPGDPPEMSRVAAGRPSPGTQLRVHEGELQVRGPLCFTGYYGNDEANRNAFTPDRWFRTGDLAEQKGDYYSITGRSKDIINRGGVKFNPAEVEVLLDAHPKILQSAIVPMPDPVLGEKACAFVVLRENNHSLVLDDVVGYLLDKRIAKNKLPERLVVVPEMPLTPTRKIIKSRLKLPE